MNIFGGMKILWIFLGGHHKIGLNLGVISMHFRVFSLLGCLKFLIFWGANGRCLVRAYVQRKNESTPPPPPPAFYTPMIDWCNAQ